MTVTNINKLNSSSQYLHKITVIVPVYNNEHTVNTAITSIYSQGVEDLELILVDDGSDVDIEPMIRSDWPDKNITIIRQKNEGPASARNKGIEKATGEFIAFLDADDEWLPVHLIKCMEFIEKGKFDWVATAYYCRNIDGLCEYKTFSDRSYMYDQQTGHVTLLKRGLFWFSSVPIMTFTTLFRRTCLQQLGGFDTSFRIGEDSDLYLMAEEAGYSCGFLNEATTYYNYNPLSITRNKKQNILQEHLRVAKKHATILGLHNTNIKKTYSDFIWHAARNYYNEKKYSEATKCCVKSLYIYFDIEKIISATKTKCTSLLYKY